MRRLPPEGRPSRRSGAQGVDEPVAGRACARHALAFMALRPVRDHAEEPQTPRFAITDPAW